MHRLRIRSLALLAAGLYSAAPLCAQQSETSHTHVVKKGDTLWDLAKSYLGDSFLWPEIYRLNTDKIEDPHWIYPGEALNLPGAGNTMAVAPTASTSEAPVAAPAPRRQMPARRTTVFDPNANSVERRARQSLNLRAGAAAVRSGEYRASPFLWTPGGPEGAGVLEEAAEAVGISMTTANRPIQYLEPVFVHLPAGASDNIGAEYLVYRLDSLIVGHGQVVIPTGVVKVIAPGPNGRSRAQLTQKFEDVFTGQSVTAMDTLHLAPGVLPARVEFGLATHVMWINYAPVLPGSGTYLILAATAKDGLTPGDQITLLRSRGEDSKGVALPDEEVAVAQLTRVTPYGAAAIILRTLQAGVAEGMKARVTAKMP